MNLDDLLHSPWFYSSPGPMSLTYYAILIIIGAYLVTKRIEYKKRKWLSALTDSFFLNGFIILSGDIIWMLICAWRFLPTYPESLFQVVSVLGRDIVGMILCYFLVGGLIHKGVIKFKTGTFVAYIALTLFLFAIFVIAADPTWTDWTYAIRQGRSTRYILSTLVFTYGIGKVLSTFLWWSWWKT